MNSKFNILVIIAVIGFLGAGLFFAQSLQLRGEIKNLAAKLETTQKDLGSQKEALAEAEKELIYYKNTDLAKELEILQLKFDNRGRELAETQKELTAAQNQAANLKAQVTEQQTSNQKIRLYLEAIDATEDFLAAGPTSSGVAKVDTKVAALKDSLVSSKWAEAKAGIDVANKSWNGSAISDTVKTITSRIRNLAP